MSKIVEIVAIMDTQRNWRIALLGTPNSGKTTLFNALTRSREHVGNYPGVTVDRASGLFSHHGQNFIIEDLPGLYSIHAPSAEERVSVTALFDSIPDLTLVACDATNLERGLHLVLQIIELGIPLCVVITKTDVLTQIGSSLDVGLLSKLLKCPVFTTETPESEAGIERFFDVLLGAVLNPGIPPAFRYPNEIENEIIRVQDALINPDRQIPFVRAVATALLSSLDSPVIDASGFVPGNEIHELVDQSHHHVRTVFDESPAMTITKARYGIVRGMLRESLSPDTEADYSLSDFLDRLFLWRLTGIPMLLLTLFVIFFIPFVAGAPLSSLVDSLFTDLAGLVRSGFEPGAMRDLIADGVIGGVGGVLVFVPQLFLLYAVIAFIESSGYMARAAFVLDGFMHKIGLHGKSFLPFLLGFGCTVPAILSTRTLENKNDRLATMMALPFISCSARLPVFTLLIAALFPPHLGGLILLGLYSFGIIMALITARIFRRHVFYAKHEDVFLMDLPPWRLPTPFGIIHQAAEQSLHFLKKAGTVLLLAAIAFWFLSNYPQPSEEERAAHTARIQDLETRGHVLSAQPAMTNAGVVRATASIILASSDFSNAVSNASPISQQYRMAETRRAHALASISNADITSYTNARTMIIQREILQNRIREVELAWQENLGRKSYAGRLGNLIAPLLSPLGLDDWKIAVALVSGFAAKEMVVTTLGSIYGTSAEDTEGLTSRLRRDPVFLSRTPVAPSAVLSTEAGGFKHAQSGLPVIRRDAQYYSVDPVTALSLLVFILLYVPCQAATLIFAREAGLRLALVMIIWTTLAAWGMSALVYQIGQILHTIPGN